MADASAVDAHDRLRDRCLDEAHRWTVASTPPN
jgi:hypothetical protein